jgi:hypothetical protein
VAEITPIRNGRPTICKDKNMKTKLTLIAFFISLFAFSEVNAQQCNVVNTAFQAGENIQYNLYFNKGIVRIRSGRGSLVIENTNFRGAPAYKTTMLLNTSGFANAVYTVNDTLISYVDKNLRPLLFTKNAFEGKDYSIERQSFTYDGDQISIETSRIFNGVQRFDETVTTDKCTYDYLSVLLYVRNLDFDNMKPGDRQHIQFISGRNPVNMYVNFLGTSTLRADDGNRYNVINISLTILDDAFQNQRDAIRASLSNDANRIPVVIDTVLRIGTVRAMMRGFSGQRN